jgi:hypothetical protein
MGRLISGLNGRFRAKLLLSSAPAGGLSFIEKGPHKKRTTQVSKLETWNRIMCIR